MPIEYSLSERAQPGAPASAPKKVYATAKSTGETTQRSLAERIAEMSSLSPVDVMAAIEAFLQIVPQELAEGRIVRLGEFGAFRTTLRGKGAATIKEFTNSLITDVNVKFTPGRLFSQHMKGAVLRRIEK